MAIGVIRLLLIYHDPMDSQTKLVAKYSCLQKRKYDQLLTMNLFIVCDFK
jgi:hypothetical protein